MGGASAPTMQALCSYPAAPRVRLRRPLLLIHDALSPGSCFPACTGLSLLNISLDTLQPERFVAMTRRQGHERVMGAIGQALDLGFDPGACALVLFCVFGCSLK